MSKKVILHGRLEAAASTSPISDWPRVTERSRSHHATSICRAHHLDGPRCPHSPSRRRIVNGLAGYRLGGGWLQELQPTARGRANVDQRPCSRCGTRTIFSASLSRGTVCGVFRTSRQRAWRTWVLRRRAAAVTPTPWSIAVRSELAVGELCHRGVDCKPLKFQQGSELHPQVAENCNRSIIDGNRSIVVLCWIAI